MSDGLEYLVNGSLSPVFSTGGGANGAGMKRTGSARSGGSASAFVRWEEAGGGGEGGGGGEPMQVEMEMEEGLVSA